MSILCCIYEISLEKGVPALYHCAEMAIILSRKEENNVCSINQLFDMYLTTNYPTIPTIHKVVKISVIKKFL